ncbi:MAG: DUF6268 family outer membrane beta-barrel protein [Candidatus Omnitrophota bacterium]
MIRGIVFYLCVLVIFLSFSCPVFAAEEKIEVLKLEAYYLKSAKVDDPKTGTFEENLEARPSLVDLRFSYPHLVDEGTTYLIQGFSFQNLNLNYRNWDRSQDTDNADEFYAFNYEIALYHKYSEQWAQTIFIHPGLASDFEDASVKDMHIAAGALFDCRINDNTAYGLGAVYMYNSFGDSYFLPLVSFSSKNKTFSAQCILPAKAQAWYLGWKRMDAGIIAKFSGNQYRVNQAGMFSNRLNYYLFTLGPALRWHWSKNVDLNFEAGSVLFHRIQLYKDETKIRAMDLKNNWFFMAGLALNF